MLAYSVQTLQKLLKPIYDLTRKGRQFVWGKEQQEAFEEIKHRLQKPPVLHMPDKVDVDVREIDKANGIVIVLQLTPKVNKDMYFFVSDSRVFNSNSSILLKEDF